MNKPITVAIVGLGNRGMYAYGSKILERSDEIKVVAAADVDSERLALMAKVHGIAPENCFNSADELIAQPSLQIFFLSAPRTRITTRKLLLPLKKAII